ncbi:ERCC4 domain-containing protein [Gordonia sp. NPDC003429]
MVEIVVDSRERYADNFSAQQATTEKRALPVGDYAVLDGDVVVAAAERKSIEDLSGSVMSGKLTYAMAELASLPHGAVVVDSGYSRLFKLEHVSTSAVADAVAEAHPRRHTRRLSRCRAPILIRRPTASRCSRRTNPLTRSRGAISFPRTELPTREGKGDAGTATATRGAQSCIVS